MVTSSADSICRRFSSSAPHRRARRWLSTGSRRTSTGFAFILGSCCQTTPKRMRPALGDAHIDELTDQLRPSGEIHDAVVAGAAGELVPALLRHPFDQHAFQ